MTRKVGPQPVSSGVLPKPGKISSIIDYLKKHSKGVLKYGILFFVIGLVVGLFFK